VKREIWTVGGLTVSSPATQEEFEYVGRYLREEEAGEERDTGGGRRERAAAFIRMRRTFVARHNGYVLAIAGITDTEWNGKKCRYLAMERTVHALEIGHRFTWIRAYAALAKWLVETDGENGWRGPIMTLTPTDLPRALDVYKYANVENVGTVTVGRREYWILKIKAGR